MSDSLWPHGLKHARLPCPSLSPWICSKACPLSRWCYLAISSSATTFFFCPQSFPTESFPMSQFFASGGQSIRASASVFPMSIQGWFLLGVHMYTYANIHMYPCSLKLHIIFLELNIIGSIGPETQQSNNLHCLIYFLQYDPSIITLSHTNRRGKNIYITKKALMWRPPSSQASQYSALCHHHITDRCTYVLVWLTNLYAFF